MTVPRSPYASTGNQARGQDAVSTTPTPRRARSRPERRLTPGRLALPSPTHLRRGDESPHGEENALPVSS